MIGPVPSMYLTELFKVVKCGFSCFYLFWSHSFCSFVNNKNIGSMCSVKCPQSCAVDFSVLLCFICIIDILAKCSFKRCGVMSNMDAQHATSVLFEFLIIVTNGKNNNLYLCPSFYFLRLPPALSCASSRGQYRHQPLVL